MSSTFAAKNGITLHVNFAQPIDLSLPIIPVTSELQPAFASPSVHPRPSCFHTPDAKCNPTTVGTWVGDIRKGAGCNCFDVSFCPHTNGTHAESLGHILAGGLPSINDISPACSLHPALLLSVQPVRFSTVAATEQYPTAQADDWVISRAGLQAALEALALTPAQLAVCCEALILKIQPSLFLPASKKEAALNGAAAFKRFDFSGANPPYLTASCTEYIAALGLDGPTTARGGVGVQHLLCDLPSMDREDDGGKMCNHRNLFRFPAVTPSPLPSTIHQHTNTITELLSFGHHEQLKDGVYLLDLQITPLQVSFSFFSGCLLSLSISLSSTDLLLLSLLIWCFLFFPWCGLAAAVAAYFNRIMLCYNYRIYFLTQMDAAPARPVLYAATLK